MNSYDEDILYHILSGKTNINVDRVDLVVEPPTYNDIYESCQLYNKIYRRMFLFDATSKDDILDILIMRNLWSVDQENELERLSEQIDGAKLDLYQTYVGFGDINIKRKVIHQLNSRHNELWYKKTQFDRFTIDGIASYHKTCYLLCCGSHIDYYTTSLNINKLYYEYISQTPNEVEIRKIVKNNEWRDYWRAIKLGYKIFGDVLTREQYSLLSWSQFYDNVYESSECPNDEVINDDDLLDGWCLFQRKKRKEESKKKAGDKYGNANEVFIPVATPEQAMKVHEMNDSRSRMIKKQRESLIVQKGSILEQELPDAKSRMREQAMQEFKNKGTK